MRVAVVCPVFRNAETLEELVARLSAALDGHEVVVRLVVDACPDRSAEVAVALAAARAGVRATVLERNVGQHRALARGLADEPEGDAWVCLDADLQDPPEAVPSLLAGLGPAAAVFAGRRGPYESRARLLTGAAHRRLVTALTGLPPDAGAFLAVDARGRSAVVEAVHRGDGPSVVAALGAARLPVASVPVERAPRPVGRSAWSTRRRLAQSWRTLAWLSRRSAGSRARRPGRS